MAHYEERLQTDLEDIRGQVGDVARDVEEAVSNALRAVLEQDRALASRTMLGDHPINRAIRRIDAHCHNFVARHLPAAGHLRFISAVLRLDIAIERVGDYAVTISREQVQLSGPPPEAVARDIEMVGELVLKMLRRSVRSFLEGDVDLARSAMGMAEQLDTISSKVFRDLLAAGAREAHSETADLFALLLIVNRLERVGAQAKNVCEQTLFAVAGEQKHPKVYRVLFVDEDHGGLSRLAQALAQRAFPESGQFSSAGWSVGGETEPAMAAFLERSGFDAPEAVGHRLDDLQVQLEDFHVIVGLNSDPHERLQTVPFHTACVSWTLTVPDADLDQERAEAALADSSHQLGVQIRDLMVTLRGEEAI